MRCKSCKKNVISSEAKNCSVCQTIFHYHCLNISAENFAKESKQTKCSWKCPDCKSMNKRDSTPSRVTEPGSPNIPDISHGSNHAIVDELKQYFDEKLHVATNKILSDVASIKSETKSINKTVDELKNSVEYVCAQYDELHKIFNEKMKIIDNLQKENECLRSEVTKTNQKLLTIEQQSRSCNVEIQCVPENKNENLLIIVRNLLNTVSSDMSEHDIMDLHRVPKVNKDSERPRSIVVKLVSPRMRDSLLADVKKFNKINSNKKLNTSHLKISGIEKAVYVSEHLSPANKLLHAATRKFAKEHKFEFVWVRGGRVFIRKDINSKSMTVLNHEMLNTLIV